MILVLPDRTCSPAENMATDLLLLEKVKPGAVFFRIYGWSEPAVSFGVSQSRDRVRAEAGEGVTLVRRPTGGGIVRHFGDMTYTLIAPAGHPLAEMRASESYRVVHAALASGLRHAGVPAGIVPCARESCANGGEAPAETPREPGVCFERPETYDVAREDDGRKLAGAAQKRTREGILFQGSVDLNACGEIDRRTVEESFLAHLATVLDEEIASGPFPLFSPDTFARAVGKFTSEAWNGKR